MGAKTVNIRDVFPEKIEAGSHKSWEEAVDRGEGEVEGETGAHQEV